MQTERVGVFVDVQNLYYSARHLYHSYVDFGSILRKVTDSRILEVAYAYVVRADVPKQPGFFDALKAEGYELRMKDIQTFPGGVQKGNWDVGIAVDAMKALHFIDVVVLVTGDGDFVDLVHYFQEQGKRVEAMAFGRSASGKLKEAVDRFIDLEKTPDDYLKKKIPGSQFRDERPRQSRREHKPWKRAEKKVAPPKPETPKPQTPTAKPTHRIKPPPIRVPKPVTS